MVLSDSLGDGFEGGIEDEAFGLVLSDSLPDPVVWRIGRSDGSAGTGWFGDPAAVPPVGGLEGYLLLVDGLYLVDGFIWWYVFGTPPVPFSV